MVTVADSFSDLDLVSILINNIVAYLDDLNKMYTTSKYDTSIKFLKFGQYLYCLLCLHMVIQALADMNI